MSSLEKTSEEVITAKDLVDVLEAAGALGVFNRLSPADQENFSDWIGKARNDDSHWRRIDAIVSAMKEGPLGPRKRKST